MSLDDMIIEGLLAPRFYESLLSRSYLSVKAQGLKWSQQAVSFSAL